MNPIQGEMQNGGTAEDQAAEGARQSKEIEKRQGERMVRGILAPWSPILASRHSGLFLMALLCGVVLGIVHSPSSALAHACKDSVMAATPNTDFTFHQDGTVTHNTTGYMWMRCSLGQEWNGKTCTGAPANFTWKEALQQADRFEFAGYSDWRLPNKNELESIVEERCFSPAINEKVFPATPLVYFWTSSPYAGFSQGAWSVDFGFGAVNASDKDGSIAVRLVRGGQ